MRALGIRIAFWLVLFGLAIGCMIALADGTEGAVEKPSQPGQYDVGYMNTTYVFDKETETADVTYYYPATSPGFNTTPDTSGAPYPTILWYWWGDLNQTYEKEIYELVTSHGFVFAVNYIWPERIGVIPPWTEGVESWTSFVDKLEELDGDPSTPLYGMIDKEKYGVLGHRGGIIAGGYAKNDGRCSMAGFLSGTMTEQQGEDQNKLEVPYHCQRAGYEDWYEEYTLWSYHFAQDEKSLVLVTDAHIYEGGYDLGMLVAFCLYYLYDYEDYRTFLYGEVAIQGFLDMEYELEFWLSDDEVFPPDAYVEELNAPIYMDHTVSLELIFPGYPDFHNSSNLDVNWWIDNDPDLVPYKYWIVNHEFPDPGEHKVLAEWTIGEFSDWTDPYYFTVVNEPPVANPGPSRTVNMDEEVVFDGSASSDTTSHNDDLEFNWSIEYDGKTEHSNESTYKLMATEEGLLEATLTVRDPLGAEDISICYITVNNVAPTVTAEGMAEALEDEVVSFTGQGFDTPSHAGSLKYWWDFGDGTEMEEADTPDAIHAYATSGTFKVTLWVKDPSGAEGNATVNITVTNVAPDGGFQDIIDVDMYVDQQIAFMCWYKDTPSDNLTLVITWDFGDGNTSEGPYVSHTYEKADEYTITLTIEDDDGATKVATTKMVIYASEDEDRPGPALNAPMVVSISILLVVILGLTAYAATEPGKYSLGLLSAPLFTKTKDVMDNKTRLALHGVIVERPGIHYSAIREEFGLANGAAAYHLNVLERESFIRSVRDGKLKRFYSAHVKVPEDMGRTPEATREAIVELVRERPGINQLEVMEELGLDRASASYYLRELVKEGRLKAGKQGWYTVYSIKGEK